MKCKKCKKEIPAESVYCMWCGIAQKRDKKKSMYQRPDGLFEKSMQLDGKRVTFRGKTEKDVIQKVAEYQGAKEKGVLFSTLAEEWKAEAWDRIAHNSKSGYSAAYNRIIERFGEAAVTDIDGDGVKDFFKDLGHKGYAQKTVATHKIVLNQIMDLAVGKSGVLFNPVSNVKLPRNLPKTKRLLPSDEDTQKIIDSVDSEFGLFPFFVMYSGCRLGEALGITGADILRNKKELDINKSVYWVGTTPHIKEPKTEAGNRVPPLPDVLINKLPEIANEQYLFGGDSPLKKHQYEKMWAAYRKATGITATPHQIRHAYATILYEAGVNVKDAQYFLGHSNIAMTMDIYTHISKRKKSKSAKQLNTFINKNTQKRSKSVL